MGTTRVLRSRSSQVLAVAMVIASVLALATAVVDGLDAVLRYGGALALFGAFAWAAFWQPHVEVSDGGVKVANLLRTIEVPWPALHTVEGRYGLRLRTAYGAVVAWGADAPVGRRRSRGVQSHAAAAVMARHEELRRAGHLADPQLERPTPRTTWHVRTSTALALLAVATVALPLFA
jgi:Bacterial PH domain